jgi:hypothetical protein
MATTSRRAPAPKRKRTGGPPAKASPPASLPYLRFHHSAQLREKTLALLDAIERARDPARHKSALSNLIMELTRSGMDAYFMQPLKLTRPGLLVEQSTALGLAGIQEVMGSVVGQIVGRMDDAQMLSVCRSIRQFML